MNDKKLRYNKVIQGFTLIELIISLAIIGILLGMISYMTVLSSNVSRLSSSQSELLREGQIAQQLLAGRIRDSIYIYSYEAGSGTKTISLGSGITNTAGNTTDGTLSFDVGPNNQNPAAIAMIVPPNRQNECHSFYAYYPIQRRNISGNSVALAESSKVAEDPANSNSWVLMEFSRQITSSTGGCWMPLYNNNQITNLPDIRTLTQGGSGRILVEYVGNDPTNNWPDLSFEIQRPEINTSTLRPNGEVTFSFELARDYRGRTISTSDLSTTVISRNWRHF